MNTYQTVTGLSITGENLQDAIEKGMDEIANALNLGNSAGYQLHQAYAEYDKNENTVVLHITACGSDTERGYDPAEDVPKPYSIGIIAPEDDCPERLDIEVADSPIFSPFDDACLTSPASIYGAMLGIIDEISQHHCRHNYHDEGVGEKLSRFIPYSEGSPTFTEECFRRLFDLRPNFMTDKEVLHMLIRAFELLSKCMGHDTNKYLGCFLSQHFTAKYFKLYRYTTDLPAIREAKGMTEKQLADAAQMTVKQLKRYEKSPGSTLHCASRAVIERLADALGVETSEIIAEDDE